MYPFFQISMTKTLNYHFVARFENGHNGIVNGLYMFESKWQTSRRPCQGHILALFWFICFWLSGNTNKILAVSTLSNNEILYVHVYTSRFQIIHTNGTKRIFVELMWFANDCVGLYILQMCPWTHHQSENTSTRNERMYRKKKRSCSSGLLHGWIVTRRLN